MPPTINKDSDACDRAVSHLGPWLWASPASHTFCSPSTPRSLALSRKVRAGPHASGIASPSTPGKPSLRLQGPGPARRTNHLLLAQAACLALLPPKQLTAATPLHKQVQNSGTERGPRSPGLWLLLHVSVFLPPHAEILKGRNRVLSLYARKVT